MAQELAVDIVARFNELRRQLSVATKGFDNLEKEIRQTGATAAKAGVQIDNAAEAAQKLGRGARRSSSSVYQLGQAVSDFAVAGFRGAANNIELLAFQMGLSGPLIGAITAASVALVVFSDDIAAALDPIGTKAKEAESAYLSLVKVIRKETAQLGIKEEDIPGEIKRIQSEILKLENQVRGSTPRGGVGLGAGGGTLVNLGLLDALLGTSSQIELLGTLKGDLAALQKLQADIDQEQRLRNNQEDAVNEINEERQRQQQTELEKAEKANERLKEQLGALRNLEGSRLGFILDQNTQLQEQIKIVKRLNDARREGGGSLGVSGVEPVEGAGLQGPASLIGKGDKLGEGALSGFRIRTLSDTVILDVKGKLAALRDEEERTRAATEQLSSSIGSGLAGAFASLAESIGSGEGMFDGLRKTIGEFAIDMGNAFIGFGFAGLALKAFIKNPVTAIVAGAGLVALGAALKKSAEEKTDRFIATGSSAGGIGSNVGVIDPRERAAYPQFSRARSLDSSPDPVAPYYMGYSNPEPFEFRLSGEDLVASQRRTTQRQSRTRATTTRSNSGR